MLKLAGPRRPRKPSSPRVVKVRGAECPVHNAPVYLGGRRVFCPAYERYRPADR